MENYYNVPFCYIRTEPDFTILGKGTGTLYKVYNPQNYKISRIIHISYMTGNSAVLFICSYHYSIHFSILKHHFNHLIQYALQEFTYIHVSQAAYDLRTCII
jgi:hypothetical protein